MEFMRQGLSEIDKLHLLDLVQKLNKEFQLNLFPTVSLALGVIDLELNGIVDGIDRSFRVKAVNVDQARILAKEHYKRIQMAKRAKKTVNTKGETADNPRELPALYTGNSNHDLSELSTRPSTSLGCARALTVIIVEDDLDAMNPVNKAVKSLNLSVSYCMSGADAIIAVPALQPDLIILDWHLGDTRADKILKHLDSILLNDHSKPIKVITYSGSTKEEVVLGNLLKFDRIDHWTKPIGINEMTKRLESLSLQSI